MTPSRHSVSPALAARRCFATSPARAQELTIVSAGGAWQAAQHQAWYEPFAEKMGIKFNEQENTGDPRAWCRRWCRPAT